jgi:large subunit ribosomal protein L15
MEHLVTPTKGARRKSKRIGRGNGSGRGTYSGKGLKGQKSRSGKGPRPGFEGGQTPLIKRLAEKRGFTNIFRIEYSIVNVGDLVKHEGNEPITPSVLVKAGLIKNTKHPVKILGGGDLGKALSFKAHKFSLTARKKIEKAGGEVEEISK